TGRTSQATRELHLFLAAGTFGSGTTFDVVTRIRVSGELNAEDSRGTLLGGGERVRPLGAGEGRRHEKSQEQSARRNERLIHGAPPLRCHASTQACLEPIRYVCEAPEHPLFARGRTRTASSHQRLAAEPRATELVYGHVARVVRQTGAWRTRASCAHPLP